jgi:hypothetical protein
MIKFEGDRMDDSEMPKGEEEKAIQGRDQIALEKVNLAEIAERSEDAAF